MATIPPHALLDRDIARVSAAEEIRIATPMIQEIVNYGLAAFLRCLTTARARGAERHPPLFLLLHVMEMIDGAQVLIMEAAPVPARLQLRSAFEALLGIEYILADRTRERAFAYLVVAARSIRRAHRIFDPGSDEARDHRRRMEADRYVGQVQMPAIPDLNERMARIEEMLQSPGWREANDEFERVRRERRGRRPAWYELYDGPHSLEELALRTGRPGQYEMLYRQWSGTAHAGDVLTRQVGEDIAGYRGLRDVQEIRRAIGLAATIGLGAIRQVLLFFRPEEADGIRRWYIDNIQNSFQSIGGWRFEP